MKLTIHTTLDYNLPGPTDVLLQLEAAAIPEQVIEQAHIAISPTEHFARVPGHDTIGDRRVHVADPARQRAQLIPGEAASQDAAR